MQPAPPTPAAHVIPPPLATRAVDPDDIADAGAAYLVEHAGTLEQHREVFGAERRRRRLEPRVHLVLEVLRGMDGQPVLTVRQAVADALDEFFLGFVRRMLFAREHDDVLAFLDNGVGLLVRLEPRGDAAAGH
jgi:hypothetical protein